MKKALLGAMCALTIVGCSSTEEAAERKSSRSGASAGESSRSGPSAGQLAAAERAAEAEETRIRLGRLLSATDAVRKYYEDLGEKDFAAAWKRLAPSVRDANNGFAAWRAGYETTISTTVLDAEPEALNGAGSRVEVVVRLRSVDLDICGDRKAQRFAGSWTLELVDGMWRATDIFVRKTGGGTVRTEYSQCPEDDLPVEGGSDYDLYSDDDDDDEEDEDYYTPSYDPPSYDPPSYDPDYTDGDGTYNGAPTTEDFGSGKGSVGRCADGTYSDSIGRPGACSHHGGVGG